MTTSDEFVEKYSWMVRPCFLYKEEYSDCTSIRSRFYQQFIHGQFSDCSSWNRDHDDCCKWVDNKDRKALKQLIERELARRYERLNAHEQNDVWEKRTELPPPGWNDPLPKHIQERIEKSYLAIKAKQLQEGTTSSMSSICVIQ